MWSAICYTDSGTMDKDNFRCCRESRVILKIILGEVENAVYHPPAYLDNQYEDEWITDPLRFSDSGTKTR